MKGQEWDAVTTSGTDIVGWTRGRGSHQVGVDSNNSIVITREG